MISERISAQKAFGSTYHGFYRKIQPRFANVRRIFEGLTLPASAISDPARTYRVAARELIDGLGQIYSNDLALHRARKLLDSAPASPSTFTFVAHYFKKASKGTVSEFDAVKNIVDNFPAILISTAQIAYPSHEGKSLIESLRHSKDGRTRELIQKLFPEASLKDIDTAVRASFNPFNILEGQSESTTDILSEDVMRYIWSSKKALLSFGRTIGIYSDGKPDPLWVFLLRDAHIIYQVAKDELPGEKMELELCKVSLATQEELRSAWDSRGYNIGWSKDPPKVEAYAKLLAEIGSRVDIEPPDSLTTREITHNLLVAGRREESDFEKTYSRFRQAQRILANLTVPEQVGQLLVNSGIESAAEGGRPVVFVDTGFRGSLPLLLQSALSRTLRENGHEPNVHVWLDYMIEPLAHLGTSHVAGPWPVSPLDGLVSLNRMLTPSGRLQLFTTPFDAERQARILRPFDRFEEMRKAA